MSIVRPEKVKNLYGQSTSKARQQGKEMNRNQRREEWVCKKAKGAGSTLAGGGGKKKTFTLGENIKH